jgi:hypothetical protein
MSEPRRRPPFFLRKFFVVMVLILLVAAGVGAWFALDFVHRYERKAAEFDLSKLDSVESASVIYDRYGQVFGKISFKIGNRSPWIRSHLTWLTRSSLKRITAFMNTEVLIFTGYFVR